MDYGLEIFLNWCSWPGYFLCYNKLPFFSCHTVYSVIPLGVSCSEVKHQLLSLQIKVSRIQDVNSDFNVPGMLYLSRPVDYS